MIIYKKKMKNKKKIGFSRYLYMYHKREAAMVIETYNIPLLMDEANAEHWLRMLECAKDAYNMCARHIVENKVPLSLKAVHASCYRLVRSEFPTLSSQMAIKCEQAAASAVKSLKAKGQLGKSAIPQRRSLTMTLDKRLYGTLSVNGITLTGATRNRRTLVPFGLYEKAMEMLTTYKACDPTIFIRDGRFYLSVPFEVPEMPVTSETCIGVDLGMRQLFVTSEGKSFRDATYLARRRRIRHLKRRLQSKGTKSARRHLRKLSRKERNLGRDMCYRASKALIASTKAGIIVMEDLSKIKKSTSRTKEGYRKRRHNNAISQVPFYMFRQIVTYKAPLSGKTTETVSPAYTSQTDSRTGKRDGMRLGRRYVCSDGVVLDADWNAAVNIGLRSRHPVSSSAPLDGALTPLTGRRQSARRTHHDRQAVGASPRL